MAEYRMKLAIAENPHREKPEELWKALEDPEKQEEVPQLDKAAFNILKMKMSRSPHVIVK